MKQVRDHQILSGIAQALKGIRESRGLTQLDVYNDTNIHIARIETSRVNVTVSSLSILCKYFGISLQDFFKEVAFKQ